jgi:hypothetical protein
MILSMDTCPLPARYSNISLPALPGMSVKMLSGFLGAIIHRLQASQETRQQQRMNDSFRASDPCQASGIEVHLTGKGNSPATQVYRAGAVCWP